MQNRIHQVREIKTAASCCIAARIDPYHDGQTFIRGDVRRSSNIDVQTILSILGIINWSEDISSLRSLWTCSSIAVCIDHRGPILSRSPRLLPSKLPYRRLSISHPSPLIKLCGAVVVSAVHAVSKVDFERGAATRVVCSFGDAVVILSIWIIAEVNGRPWDGRSQRRKEQNAAEHGYSACSEMSDEKEKVKDEGSRQESGWPFASLITWLISSTYTSQTRYRSAASSICAAEETIYAQRSLVKDY